MAEDGTFFYTELSGFDMTEYQQWQAWKQKLVNWRGFKRVN